MGRNTLVKRLTSKNGVLRVRIGETRKERFAIRHRREDEDPEAPEAFGPSKDPGESEDDPASEGGAGVGVAQDREKASEASAEAKKPPPSPKASGGVGSADPHAKARARLKAAKAAGS
jgi:hypothetical protein